MKTVRAALIVAGSLMIAAPAMAASDTGRYACGGEVEKEVWALWDGGLRQHLRGKLIGERFLHNGDGNALYDLQTYTQSLLSMARRCRRGERLEELASLVRQPYEALVPGTSFSPGRRWLCRSGSLCAEGTPLHDTEVLLYSVQYLGLAASLANALATSGAVPDGEARRFVRETAQISIEHLLRWARDGEIEKLERNTRASAGDVRGTSSAKFFTDKPLWMIAIYAELAGILAAPGAPSMKDIALDKEKKDMLQRHLTALLRFFGARVSVREVDTRRFGKVMLADLDRGYWRFYPDNLYAGYEGADPPVLCSGDDTVKPKLEVRVPPEEVPRRADTGWDISHARRLVPALDALERNRKALRRVFSVSEEDLPPPRLAAEFASTLVVDVWNGDTKRPLFANYWSGANGWFRVAYGKERGKCREGYPPYGMTSSFANGGYIAWAKYRPVIGMLGRRLHAIADSADPDDMAFIEQYYPALSRKVSAQKRALERLMFLPSLVDAVSH